MDKRRAWPLTPDWKDIYPAIKLLPSADLLENATTNFIKNMESHRRILRFFGAKEKNIGMINFNTKRTELQQVEDLIATWYMMSMVLSAQDVIYIYFIDCGIFYSIRIDDDGNINAAEYIYGEEGLWNKIIFMTTKIRISQLTGIWTNFFPHMKLPRPTELPSHRADESDTGPLTPTILTHYQMVIKSFVIPRLVENRTPSAFHYGLTWYRQEFRDTHKMVNMVINALR